MWVGGWSRGGLEDTPPRKTCFHPWPWTTFSAEGLARRAFVATGWPAATIFRLRSSSCFARDAFASFRFTQQRKFAVWFFP